MSGVAHLNAALAGRYAIEREVGAGGMATVYLARDVRHDRLVAIKVLREDDAIALGVRAATEPLAPCWRRVRKSSS